MLMVSVRAKVDHPPLKNQKSFLISEYFWRKKKNLPPSNFIIYITYNLKNLLKYNLISYTLS